MGESSHGFHACSAVPCNPGQPKRDTDTKMPMSAKMIAVPGATARINQTSTERSNPPNTTICFLLVG